LSEASKDMADLNNLLETLEAEKMVLEEEWLKQQVM
jgi:hypothetical protein